MEVTPSCEKPGILYTRHYLMLRWIEDDKPFTIEMGNEEFLADELPPLKHLDLSREELREQVNELYRAMEGKG
ncbi:unnamed protein product [marine sediment metagenome]|uniref:Uncharacterized protein n=1 Tax=marine sediment metagenome TaxID=412755 RepID=X1EXT3_9ZZZZ